MKAGVEEDEVFLQKPESDQLRLSWKERGRGKENKCSGAER